MTSIPSTNPRAVLAECLDGLNESDRQFAARLLAWRGEHTPKQAHWVGVLIERARKRLAPAGASGAAAPAAQVGDIRPIIEMLERAASSLKFPALRLDGGLRVNIAGERAREPGSLTVTSQAKGEAGREYYGRITRAGAWEPSRKLAADQAEAVGVVLHAFAADPAGRAAAYGRRTGACCFCGRELTKAESVGWGYGPVCADKWGLPHGALECAAA